MTIPDNEFIDAMAKLTSIRYQLDQQSDALREAWNEFHKFRPVCTELASDGNRCILPVGNHPPNTTHHISLEELQEDERHSDDHSRPYHLTAGRPSQTYRSWVPVELVPISLHFEDSDTIGSRVIGWVRPRDVWRLPVKQHSDETADEP